MRERAGETAGVASSMHDGASGSLYIVTLTSSTMPMALEVPAVPELTGLAVFRSRHVEDGRDRFRLHVGYFDSLTAAEAVLPAVRTYYPGAWAGTAPSSGMGSLDDTSVTQFKFIKAPNTLRRDELAVPNPVRPAVEPARPPVSKPAAPVSARPAVKAPEPPATPIRVELVRGRLTSPDRSPELAAKEVLKLLESA